MTQNQNARNDHERSGADQNLAAETRAIGDDATAVIRIFQWSGHTHRTVEVKVSSLRCYNLLVAGTPILRVTGVFERTHRFHHGALQRLCVASPVLELARFTTCSSLPSRHLGG